MDTGKTLLQPPRVLAVIPRLSPGAVLNIVKPFTALHRKGQIVTDIIWESWVSPRKMQWADVIVFYRNTKEYPLATALACGKPIIYDIDDNLFELPPQFALPPSQLTQIEHYLRSAGLVRVYSEPMRERVQQLNPHVMRVNALVDWKLLPGHPPRRNPAKIRIVYATGRWFDDPFAGLFLDDLRTLLREYRDRVQVFFWGYHPPEFQGVSAIHFLDFIPNYDRFFRRFANAGFDIGLAPLYNNIFCRSKTNNKFREYAACRIAGVYSHMDVYSACVEDGQTGLLVSHEPGSWFEAISRLVEDTALRERIQEQAFRYVRQHYSLEKTQSIWLTHLQEVVTNACSPLSLGQHVRREAMPSQQDIHLQSSRALSAFLPASWLIWLARRRRLLQLINTYGGTMVLKGGLWRAYSYCEVLWIRFRLLLASARLWWQRKLRGASSSP